MISVYDSRHVDSIGASHKSCCQHDIISPANKRNSDEDVCNPEGTESVSILMDPKELHSIICKAVCSDIQIFPLIDIKSAEKLGSLQKLKSSAAMRSLVEVFSDSGLDAQLGCNVSSGDVSLTVQIKKEMPARPFGERSWILWAMLGLLPCQREIEELHSNSDGFKGVSLANRCLELFGKQTGVGIRDKKNLCRTSSIRLALCAYRPSSPSGVRGVCCKTSFVYGPNYWLLSGYDEGRRLFSEEQLLAGRSSLVDAIMTDFWKNLELFPYAPSPKLFKLVTPRLRDYISAGVHSESASFCPSSGHLALYLHGTAGTGKSTFVSAFASALQASLRARVEPGREVRVVKGISDWSIERVVEQTVCKGHTVVLHLEEVPEDGELQEVLFSIVKGMMATIVRRYPTYAANVVYLLTSNYLASPSIAHEAEVIRVLPPGPADQAAWCRLTMQRLVASHCRIDDDDVDIHLHCSPPPAQDMRPLNRWCSSLAFHIARHGAACPPQERLTRLKAVVATGGESCLTLTLQRETRWNLSTPDGEAQPASGVSSESESEEEAGREVASRFMKTSLTAVHLRTDDGFLFYEAPLNGPGSRLQTLVDMCGGRWLKPAVLVLTGTADGKAVVLNEVKARMQAAAGPGGVVHEARVGLRCADDQEKVYGRARDIRGGIFKTMDDVNNPNLAGGGAGLVMLVCEVNTAGQFMLREVLETNDLSRTHRQAVHKDRVLFVVSVDEHVAVNDMISSRAHTIMHCP